MEEEDIIEDNLQIEEDLSTPDVDIEFNEDFEEMDEILEYNGEDI